MEQYKTLTDTYARYFDLYLRGINFYLVACGAIGFFALVEKDGAPVEARTPLLALIAIWSFLAVVVISCALWWAIRARTTLRTIEEKTGIEQQPHWLGVLAAPPPIIAALAIGTVAVILM